MKFFSKFLYYFGSVAICSIIFGAIALAFFMPKSNAKLKKEDIYTAPASRDSRLSIAVEDDGNLLGIITFDCYFTQSTVLVNYTAANHLFWANSYNTSAQKTALLRDMTFAGGAFAELRVMITDLRELALFVDNCNGALYTDNEGNTYVLMGHNLTNFVHSEDESTSLGQVFASLLSGSLAENEIDNFETQLVRLIEKSEGDFSFIHWAKHKKEFVNIAEGGSVISAK